MISLQQDSLQFNSNISYNFSGGNLSSDAGLVVVREFIEKIGLRTVLQERFDDDKNRTHKISSVIEQLIYQNIAGYHKDDAADSLRDDPIFTRILGKEALASQPTISRVLNDFTQEQIQAFNEILEHLYLMIHSQETKKQIILDLDSTNVGTYGHQEDSEYIYHYAATGYHPLMLFDGLTGDLMKMVLRKGSVYTSNGVQAFLEPVISVLRAKYPQAEILVRGDSGFAVPGLFDLCEDYGIHYLIRLKANPVLHQLSGDIKKDFLALYQKDYTQHHSFYDDFSYRAKSWSRERRVVCKVEREAGNFVARSTYIITTLDAPSQEVVKAYNKRGTMENYIKEYKLDFGCETLSHSKFLANHAKAMILAIAYNVVGAMKQKVFPREHTTRRTLSIRSMLIKFACRVVCHSRKIVIKFCSSYPEKDLFHKILRRIHRLSFG